MKQLLILLIFFFLGCLKQNGPIIKNEMILFYPSIDSVRDIELIGDTLFVANGTEGLKIFKINTTISYCKGVFDFEEGEVFETESSCVYAGHEWTIEENIEHTRLDSLYEDSSEDRDIINVYVAQSSKVLFVLDKFKYTYFGSPHNFTDIFIEKIDCDEFQSRSTIIEVDDIPQVFTLFRHIDSINELIPLTTSIKQIPISIYPISDDYNLYFEDCSIGDVLDSLNYNLTDISFANDILYLANANFNIPSVSRYKQNLDGNFHLIDEDILSIKPLTVRAYDFSYIVGLDNQSGCYIALLDSEGEIISKFTMFDGYTIRDIHYSQGLLLLSAGYDGVLVCKWDGQGEPVPYAIISSSYAYSALVYNENKIIIGTKNGIEIYEID